jgi:hypothetical protein
LVKDGNGRFSSIRRITNGSFSALARQTSPSGRRKGILFFLKKLLVLSFPGGDLGAKRVADLVAGSDGGNFFPHTVLVFQESAASVVDGRNNGLGHVHLFLFAGGNVVFVGKVSENLLEGLVSGVARANSGLTTESVFALGFLYAGAGTLV